MTKGPAKVSVRIDGDNSNETAAEALAVYQNLVLSLDLFSASEEK